MSPKGLPRTEEVVIGGVVDARHQPVVRATATRSDAAVGSDPLDARHVAEVAAMQLS
jgi:hypothetical protein